jgi:Papain-like cysteine protease AvrRpt2
MPPRVKQAQGAVFSMQQQLESEWCWAAVAQAVKTFFSPTSAITQCTIAHPVLTMEQSIPAATNCCEDPGACNVPATLQDALNVTHNLGEIVEGSVSFDDVKSELSDGNPIGVRIQWSNGGAHFIAIDGYREFTSGVQQVLVADPLNPAGSASYIDYDELLDFYDQDGIWSATFLVHP